MKYFTLCADDFGYSTEVSQGILSLISIERLTATSCMTNMPDWKNSASKLIPYKDQIDIGLHFNLTEGEALSEDKKLIQSNNVLIIKAQLRQLNKVLIKKELQCQLNAFKEAIGCLPDFIDGHQHIHQLPIIRDALIEVINENYLDKKPYVRVSANGFLKTLKQSLNNPKALIIALTGAWGLKSKLQKNNIPFNTSFSGVYDLSPNVYYQRLFKQFMKDIDTGGLIFCHPGMESNNKKDPIAETRAHEWKYFSSSDFLENLGENKLTKMAIPG